MMNCNTTMCYTTTTSLPFLCRFAVGCLMLTAMMMGKAEAAAPTTTRHRYRQMVAKKPRDPPVLKGSHHYRFTVVEDDGWVNIQENEDGTLNFTGYCIDIIRSVAASANFTYEFLPPSGLAPHCNHPAAESQFGFNVIPYSSFYRGQYLCGQGDVQEIVGNEFMTDFFQSLFYITPNRRLENRFTTPFLPPAQGGMQLFGTATHIRDIPDLIQQQLHGKQPKVCLKSNTAAANWVEKTLPDLQTQQVDFGKTSQDLSKLLQDGTCEIFMDAYPKATRHVLQLSKQDLCEFDGRPIGIIGNPLSYGFNQFAIGVNLNNISREVVDTVDYWMNEFMTCSPQDSECDSFASYYPTVGGTGYECGYVQYPPAPVEEGISVGAIVGLVVLIVGSFLMGMAINWYVQRIRQRRRIKKRFVLQLARNIRMSESPNDIDAENLAEIVHHIGGTKGTILEIDLRKWMWDINLPFLSDDDLDMLWKLMDREGTGLVTPMEFILFLKTCEKEFQTVHDQFNRMSKTEKLKLTSKSLSSLKLDGEDGCRKREFEITRRGRQNASIESIGISSQTP